MILLDTNVITRFVQPLHPDYEIAIAAVERVKLDQRFPVVDPQVLYEFWVVCTRPVAQNGLGFSIAQATAELASLLTQFPFLDDSAAIFPSWRQLVTGLGVAGKGAHDARLAPSTQQVNCVEAANATTPPIP
jgi:predicted nucleic acid-binding protein